jgi:hypothetical protein
MELKNEAAGLTWGVLCCAGENAVEDRAYAAGNSVVIAEQQFVCGTV